MKKRYQGRQVCLCVYTCVRTRVCLYNEGNVEDVADGGVVDPGVGMVRRRINGSRAVASGRPESWLADPHQRLPAPREWRRGRGRPSRADLRLRPGGASGRRSGPSRTHGHFPQHVSSQLSKQ